MSHLIRHFRANYMAQARRGSSYIRSTLDVSGDDLAPGDADQANFQSRANGQALEGRPSDQWSQMLATSQSQALLPQRLPEVQPPQNLLRDRGGRQQPLGLTKYVHSSKGKKGAVTPTVLAYGKRAANARLSWDLNSHRTSCNSQPGLKPERAGPQRQYRPNALSIAAQQRTAMEKVKRRLSTDTSTLAS